MYCFFAVLRNVVTHIRNQIPDPFANVCRTLYTSECAITDFSFTDFSSADLSTADLFLSDPFLADPFLADPFLTDPFLTDPFLTDLFIPDLSIPIFSMYEFPTFISDFSMGVYMRFCSAQYTRVRYMICKVNRCNPERWDLPHSHGGSGPRRCQDNLTFKYYFNHNQDRHGGNASDK